MAINWNTQPTTTPSTGIKWNTPAPTPEPKKKELSTREKVAKGLNLVFGGEKVGELIGTQIAKGTFGKTLQRAAVGRELSDTEESLVGPGPSAKEVVGDVVRIGANFIPGAAGGSLARNVATGLATGYAFDVGNDMAEDKSLKEILTPGLGTVVGGAAPLAFGAIKPLTQGLAKTGKKGTQVAATKAVEKIVEKRTKAFDEVFNTSGPLRRLNERSKDRGYSLSETLAANDKYIPNVDGGKITYDAISAPLDNVQKDIAYRAKAVSALTDSYKQTVNLTDLKARVYKEIEPLLSNGDEFNRVRDKIDKDFAVYQRLADKDGNIPLSALNEIKTAKYKKINWNESQDAADLYTANRVIARSARETIEETIEKSAALYGDDVSIKELNYELGRLYDVQDALEQMAKSGVTIQNGRFGRWGARAVGAIAGSGGGVTGSIAGVMTADTLVTLMQKNALMKNSAVTKLLGEIKEADPDMYAEALRIAQKNQTRFALPAPEPGAPRTSTYGNKTIPVLPPGKKNVEFIQDMPVAQTTPALPQDLSNSQLPTTNPTNAIPNNANIDPNVPPQGPQSSNLGGKVLAGMPAIPGIQEDENGEISVDPKMLAASLLIGGAARRISPKQAQSIIAGLNKKLAALTQKTFTDPKQIRKQEIDMLAIQDGIRMLQRFLK